MNRRAKGEIPSSRTVTRYATALGPAVKHEYFQLREKYKQEGLTPQEAYKRACTELQIEEKWKDLKERQAVGKAIGSGVPLTPRETKAIVPSYTPLGEIKAEIMGDEEMSQAEEVTWAKRWVAKIQNGEPAPTRFPNEGTLFWLQSALRNRSEFEKLVVRVEGPAAGGENLYLQDGQHQFKEIGKQIKEAVQESGKKLVELETGFVELLKETS
jgi:hypothetical protein